MHGTNAVQFQGGVQATNSVVVHHSMLEYYQQFPLLQRDVGLVHNLAHRVKCVGQSDKSDKSVS